MERSTTSQDEPTGVAPVVEEPTHRPDGRGYIDDADAGDDVTEAGADADDLSDGSSVEEEDTEDERSHGGWPLEAEAAEAGEAGAEELSDDEMLEWGVEDEDWELADGNFTKQYNRVRQSYAATTDAGAAGPSKPLPARNTHALRTQRAAPASAGSLSKKLVNPAILAGGVAANPKSVADRANQKDKADRATHEQVLDARTRLVLSALVNRGFFSVIEHCISTGKEANVYLAYPGDNVPPEPSPYPPTIAVKIYRTSILNFRSRKSYIEGEHRFRGGYTSAKNPRKMVRLWAEKELRNLRRLVQGGVRAPVVIEQRENVLVMEFLGQGSTASPRLKDAEISNSKLPRLYGELLVAMRRMFHHCHLVHADLSEYNILYHAGHVYIIDVSQSVEHDHPSAFDFLRSDIRNVEDFFQRRSGGEVRTLGIRRTWSFIVDESVGLTPDEELGDAGEDRLLDVLKTWLDAEPEPASADAAAPSAEQTAVDDAVFFSSYIPRSLGEVYDPERDVELLRSGQGDKLIYAGVTGLQIGDGGAEAEAEVEEEVAAPATDEVPAETEEQATEAAAEATVEPAAPPAAADAATPAPATPAPKPTKAVRFEGDDDEDEDADSDDDSPAAEKKSRGFRHEDKDAKKERKKALKEENREKRQNKMPKGEKKRLIKKSGRS
ncbi:Serine/threonine-protein kinase rio1 [Vanrija albida]|uniref:non-specific serine/threonine protein kinase n=1 Tax=Vanrija albida TaxID=181172 RepID=A0ABR3QEM9_9TREE